MSSGIPQSLPVSPTSSLGVVLETPVSLASPPLAGGSPTPLSFVSDSSFPSTPSLATVGQHQQPIVWRKTLFGNEDAVGLEAENVKNYRSKNRRKSQPKRFEAVTEPEWTLAEALDQIVKRPTELQHIRRHLSHLRFGEINPDLGRTLNRRVIHPLTRSASKAAIVRTTAPTRKFAAVVYHGRRGESKAISEFLETPSPVKEHKVAQGEESGSSDTLPLLLDGVASEFTVGQPVMARRAEGEFFLPALVVTKAQTDTYVVVFQDRTSHTLHRKHIIVSSSTDFILAAELPFGQQVLARCQDGFFYPATIIKHESRTLYMCQFQDGDARPYSRREEIFLEGEYDVGRFRLKVFQKVYARWTTPAFPEDSTPTVTTETSFHHPAEQIPAPGVVVADHLDGSYTVVFRGNCPRILRPKDITLSWKAFASSTK